jgi:hypothetical protein
VARRTQHLLRGAKGLLRALIRSVRRALGSRDDAQLALPLDAPPPRSAGELLLRLRVAGLRGVDDVQLTRNRRTMVSIVRRTLRVHEAYLLAPVAVHEAIAGFVMTRRGPGRTAAQRTILRFAEHIPRDAQSPRSERTHPDDEPVAAKLVEWQGRLNGERFGGALGSVPVRVSRRMRSRLGHYSPARDGATAEIAISRRHVRRHGFASAVQTLLHEMVHQWQDENSLPVDHGAAFKRKAREVGISPRATRVVD